MASQVRSWRPREKENNKYLEILETDTIKQEVMKEKLIVSISDVQEGFLEAKLWCRNLNNGINTWEVSFIRYTGSFVKMDQGRT